VQFAQQRLKRRSVRLVHPTEHGHTATRPAPPLEPRGASTTSQKRSHRCSQPPGVRRSSVRTSPARTHLITAPNAHYHDDHQGPNLPQSNNVISYRPFVHRYTTLLMQLQRHPLHLSGESETVAESTATARKTRYRGIWRDRRDYHRSARHDWPAAPLCGMPNGGRFMRMPPLAGLESGNVRVDDTGPDSSLAGRRKEIPLLFPSGGWWAIGQDQLRDALITELSHQRWHGRISGLVKSPTR
jgi:hypothetical protein